MRRLDERVRDYLRTLRLLIGQARNETAMLRAESEARHGELLAATREQAARLAAPQTPPALERGQLLELFHFLHADGAQARERLRGLRASPDYERAYTDPEPLISVVIPTFDNFALLRERSLPSVLAQTYGHFEVIVAGDAAPAEAREAVEHFGDPRLRFINLPYRGPYPADPMTRWRVAGVPPYNEAVQQARGVWLAPLDDDDAFLPDHLERMLTTARDGRYEFVYGRLRVRYPDGRTESLGAYPPEEGQFGLQAAMYRRDLAEIFELELADAWLELPYDWGLCRRMLEAGVGVGMDDRETVEYFPSRSWTPRFGSTPQPEWSHVPDGWAAHSGAGWDTDAVARAYAEKWPAFLAAIDGPGPLGVSHETPSGMPIQRDDLTAQNAALVLAHGLAQAAPPAGSVSVLDWGGATGHLYLLARAWFPSLTFQWHVRELPAVAATGRELLPEVSFHDDDGCLERSYDLVLVSNALQYEEDWTALLRRLASAASRRVLLTRVPLAENVPSFVVRQRAHTYGYDTEYLGWVFNRQELLEAAGLELVREYVLRDPWEVAGAPEAPRLGAFLFRVPGP